MATIDPVREARRALRHINRVKTYLDQLPDMLRGEIFRLPARQTPLILALSPKTLYDLLEAIYGVECARERLQQSLAAFGQPCRGRVAEEPLRLEPGPSQAAQADGGQQDDQEAEAG